MDPTDSGFAIISVSDSGVGMSRENLNQLFQEGYVCVCIIYMSYKSLRCSHFPYIARYFLLEFNSIPTATRRAVEAASVCISPRAWQSSMLELL